MRNYERHKEFGKMFLDIAKYVTTIVVIGSLLTEKLDMKMAIIGLILFFLILLVAFFTIQSRQIKEDNNGRGILCGISGYSFSWAHFFRYF